ncbi:MAG: hypothetical protein H6550_07070 [Chitinophagales bacterium]|nr:hypothetical protein [Chitinophagales bacterium]
MITSSSISYISQMLNEPQNINDADADSIRELVETYPYFVPARYMQAAQQHKLEPFTPDMMSRMQLYTGNWLQYSQYLQDAVNGEDVEFVVPVEQDARRKRTVPQEVADELQEERIEVETIVEEYSTENGVRTEEETSDVKEESPAIEKEIPAEGFNPGNTGFIRGKRNEAPPPPPVEEQLAEEEIASNISMQEEEPVHIDDTTTSPVSEKVEQLFDKSNMDNDNENLIPPIYTEDYFLHQGMHVSNDIPADIGKQDHTLNIPEPDKSLMVVMSFSEWLMFYKKKKQQAQEEEQDQRELKTMWQKEKLAAALEEENEEIPENVFEMAVNSITKEENLASESLAEVLVKQGRYDRAIDMYKKLSLQKPQKKAYFARKIEEILKEK